MCSGAFFLFDIDETPESLVVYSISETANDLKNLLEGYEFSISLISLEGDIEFISSSSFQHYERMGVKGYKCGGNRLASSVDLSAFNECILRHDVANNYVKNFFDDLFLGYTSCVFPLKGYAKNKVCNYVEIIIEIERYEEIDLVGLDKYFSKLEQYISKARNYLWELQAALCFFDKLESEVIGEQYLLYSFDGRLLHYTDQVFYFLEENKLPLIAIEKLNRDSALIDDKNITLSELDKVFGKDWAFSLGVLGGPDVICVNIPDKNLA